MAQPMEYALEKHFVSIAFAADRNYFIKLPASYAEDDSRTYPVLYVLHGQWDMLPTVAANDVISDDIPELIIVGVDGRGMEMRPTSSDSESPNAAGANFQQYLYDELIPEINSQYRVAPFSILSGHSNSGRFTLNAFLDQPDRFNAFFAFSPSVDDGEINAKVAKMNWTAAHQNANLTLSLADEGEHMQTPYFELIGILESAGVKNLQHKEFPEQSHQSSNIVAQIYAMNTLFTGWNPSREVQLAGLASVKKHYKDLSNKYGFEVQVPIDKVIRLTGHFSMSDEPTDHEMAVKLMAFGIQEDKDNANEFWDLGEYFSNNDMPDAATFVKDEVCKLAPANEHCKTE